MKTISVYQPYNPLDKRNIGDSIVKALMEKNLENLPPEPFVAAGVYAIYYLGKNELYKHLSETIPIYVGKAVPVGARKGNVGTADNQGKVLYNRLTEHADSIKAASNLELEDFRCRFIAVDDIWIPLAETLLIEKYKPVWNVVVDGFGNHDPGKGRYNQQRSLWDTLHPGRNWAEKLLPNKKSFDEAIQIVNRFFEI